MMSELRSLTGRFTNIEPELQELTPRKFNQSMKSIIVADLTELEKRVIAQQKLTSVRVVEPTEDEIAYARKLKKESWE